MSACSVEIVDFIRPEGNRKNLFITNIPGNSDIDTREYLYSVFSQYGIIHGIQVYQYPTSNRPENPAGFYAFVTFYSALAAHHAKESLTNKVVINGTECKISFAKRKKDIQSTPTLHFSKCQELANFYLGFNGWSTTIKLLQEDRLENTTSEDDLQRVRYVCVTRIDITCHHLNSEGMGAWEESYLVKDPTSKAKAICKSKKLAYQRALENAFSKVILIVLPNGKVTVEVDTTKPDLILTEKPLDENNVLKINELDEQPIEEEGEENAGDIDAANLHILQELEEDM